MKTSKNIINEMVNNKQHDSFPKIGQKVSFEHHTGKIITGNYKGKGMMGGKSYHKIDDEKNLHYVPLHTKLT